MSRRLTLLSAVALLISACGGGGGDGDRPLRTASSPQATETVVSLPEVSASDFAQMDEILRRWDTEIDEISDLEPVFSEDFTSAGRAALQLGLEFAAQFGGPVFGIEEIRPPVILEDGAVEISFTSRSSDDFVATVSFVREDDSWKIHKYCEVEGETSSCYE